MAQAEIQLEILEDGTIKWETGRIPAEHHDAADLFEAELAKMLGGQVIVDRKAAKAPHVHEHNHEHTHTH